MSKKQLLPAVLFLFFLSSAFSTPKELEYFKKAYPECNFETRYIPSVDDFLVSVTCNSKTEYFFWAEGRLLPKEELQNKQNYNSLLYSYAQNIPDPKNFTKDDIKKISDYTSKSNRQTAATVPDFFYDFIYDCKTRNKAESHLIKVSFLGKTLNVHEKIRIPLKNVEVKVKELSKTDDEVATFIKNLSRADGYNWREKRDTEKKSMHSIGIAIDILPKGWGQKNLYWVWRRDIDKENWMILPLERRWLPPQKVIEAFESEGFVFGGKWINWDNMHFEYTPEILYYNNFLN